MKNLIFVLLILTGLQAVSCRSGKPADQSLQPSAYKIGTAEFATHTPSQYHDLKLGMTEEAVQKALGKPSDIKKLWSLGVKGESVGERYTYLTGKNNGLVWVDFDTNFIVTGVYWRSTR